MKKQIMILAAAFITAALFSCSKEKIKTNENSNNEEMVAVDAKKPGGNGVPQVSNKGLLCRYEFNSNLKDTTGKLKDGESTANRILFTTDRKGNTNWAIHFNEAYGVNIFDVPIDDEMSISVWVKNKFYPEIFVTPFVEAAHSFAFSQLENMYQASYSVPFGFPSQYVISDPIDNDWHHLAATRDGISLKFYIDGNLIGTSPTPAGAIPQVLTDMFQLGYGWNTDWKYWNGSMDDLRIYRRVLSASEVQTLYNF
jgi:hypothetical protein